jgi:hypothetical protein
MTLPVSPLQLGLIVAGVALVVGVMIYNWWLERRVRRRIETTFRKPAEALASAGGGTDASSPRCAARATSPMRGIPAYRPAESTSPFAPPMDVIAHRDGETKRSEPVPAIATIVESEGAIGRAPDPEIECIVTLQPAKPVGVGAIAAGLHARLGKRLRWFGRTMPEGPWHALADRHARRVRRARGVPAARRPQRRGQPRPARYVRARHGRPRARTCPRQCRSATSASEAERAEALDRLCADVDVQVGLTVLVKESGSVAGTRLRGVAEAAGFKLAPGGKFEWCRKTPARSSTP